MTTTTDRAHLDDGAGGVLDAAVHRPGHIDGCSVLLTHGAGGDLSGRGLVALCDGIAERGHVAVRFNLPYRQSGRSSPPAAEKSVPGYVAAFTDAAARLGGEAWAAGGKSYGGRVASLAVADGMPAVGLVFYGYPLHPPGKPESLRVDHFPGRPSRACSCRGRGIPFCDLDLLGMHIGRLGGAATVHVIEGGDHSLKVAGSAAPDGRPRSEAAVLAEVAAVVTDWLTGL